MKLYFFDKSNIFFWQNIALLFKISLINHELRFSIHMMKKRNIVLSQYCYIFLLQYWLQKLLVWREPKWVMNAFMKKKLSICTSRITKSTWKSIFMVFWSKQTKKFGKKLKTLFFFFVQESINYLSELFFELDWKKKDLNLWRKYENS